LGPCTQNHAVIEALQASRNSGRQPNHYDVIVASAALGTTCPQFTLPLFRWSGCLISYSFGIIDQPRGWSLTRTWSVPTPTRAGYVNRILRDEKPGGRKGAEPDGATDVACPRHEVIE